ncbi:MAG: type II toxin-antitoxin system HicA family toxin [Candidatus Melainabacteria bacterium]|nr:type II toxin-antitoxin system HicA family toxin [Candidatus Melainabacteria bacterium]
MGQRFFPIHYKVLIKVFEYYGLTVVRTSGDHFLMSKPGMKRPVVIQAKQNVPVEHITNNIKAAGITREQYFEALRYV